MTFSLTSLQPLKGLASAVAPVQGRVSLASVRCLWMRASGQSSASREQDKVTPGEKIQKHNISYFN